MNTIYDWCTIAIFAAIVVLFLQRSTAAGAPKDRMIDYLPPALGCAAANYLGNEGHDLGAIVLLVATVAYFIFVLKPFPASR
ncbi:MAG TPA: hypothetical protein VF649_01830 [Sphingomonas sp.]|uniref:XrtV sorting system accessory protein n=1 Tax=Sphingomonas sp. TaxID=28214 RepID=UPI002ED95F59